MQLKGRVEKMIVTLIYKHKKEIKKININLF